MDSLVVVRDVVEDVRLDVPLEAFWAKAGDDNMLSTPTMLRVGDGNSMLITTSTAQAKDGRIEDES